MQNESNNPYDYYKKTAVFWSDMITMMSSKPTALSAVGPMRNLSTNMKKITAEITEANKEIVDFNNFLIEYYKQLSQTWTDAQNEVTLKASQLPKDEEGTESYKRVWIDIFENYFTGLFDSKKFSENYNKLISKELDLMKRWNVVMDIMLKSANMPTKQEIDEIYKELHSLKQKISKLESSTKKSDKNDAE
ncbi:MAG: poly(R)-hydroxyalkanoic acid synthase subunit PhaE [Thermoproteota archaeon]|jgi:hypothetical protein|nr:poly(R)-hydroxyalkanoic acid synthase subunit PhaE [Thermoproteota archaeon]|tara:strand:- start:574 stop:1146 length:573 start_codon:yes stop_codon:yes gene_type:complete